jgi:type II secretory pathway pseudopilin PulG
VPHILTPGSASFIYRRPGKRVNHPGFFGQTGFTIVEAVISLAILALVGLSTTVALNLFDNRAARNRNAEAARGVVDDYVNFLLDDSTAVPAVTSAGSDLDGDGVPDGVVCTTIDTRSIPGPTSATGVVPLIVTRTGTPVSVVYGTLYWRVQAVGTAYGLSSNTDLVQVNFMLAYVYRGETFYYKTLTFKASS